MPKYCGCNMGDSGKALVREELAKMKQSLALRKEGDLVLMFRLLTRISVQDLWSQTLICS